MANGVIQGQIVKGGTTTGEVGNLRVTIEESSAETRSDSTGRFRFGGLAPGNYTIRAFPGSEGRPPLVRRVRLLPAGIVDLRLDLDEAVTTLAPITVTANRPLHVIGHLPAVQDNVVYAGKKTEVILFDSLRANVAQDVERQILGRIPGATFSETAAAGFPSNGVGFRGLNPTQSIELNTRQNGVNIAADAYGYPETYYTPPSEALERIEVVRGAGSLAFGPQFGGAINYVIRQGRFRERPEYSVRLTSGSFGLLNGFGAVRGGTGRVTYSGFLHARTQAGWRPNSDYRQATGYGSVGFQASGSLRLGVEYTLYRNRIHMAGGLSDEQFAVNPDQSFRTRNWLASPWSTVALRSQYRASPSVAWETVLSYLAADRHLVWRNEEGGPGSPDGVDSQTGSFVPREVELERFHNWALESRVRFDHSWFGRGGTLTAGVRGGVNRLDRFEGGEGSTGSDFDMTLQGDWERAVRFRSVNAAVFLEGLFRPADRLALIPGVRFEFLRSTASGHTEVTDQFTPRSLRYPLFGLGAEFVTGSSSVAYANVSQAYRPILYASLTPIGSIARVDPNLRSSQGYNAELGWRGTISGLLKFDLSAFYLHYGSRIGNRVVEEQGNTVIEIANIGNSRHQGIEGYLELNPPALAMVDLFTSFGLIDARYTTGPFRGNRVEQAPKLVARGGISLHQGPLAGTLQLSHTSSSFGDASNRFAPTEDAAAGFVPGYTLLDFSGHLRITRIAALSYGVTNLANRRYFTKRTDEYPGPGILPGIARSVYFGLSTTF